MKNILFVGNDPVFSSLMAETFASVYGKQKLNAFSKSTEQGKGLLFAKAEASMKMKGYELFLKKNDSSIADEQFDCVINIVNEEQPLQYTFSNSKTWQIPKTENLTLKELNVVRDLIELKVKQLIATL